MPEVDLILGNKEKTEIDKIISQPLEEKTIVGDIFDYLLAVIGVIVSLFGGDGNGFIEDVKSFIGGIDTGSEEA